MKIAVIFDSLHPEWEDAAFKREVEEKAEEAEYDVARALMAGGHDVDKLVRPSELRFPLIVKPLLEDASIGIAQASVVEDDASLSQRVEFIHTKYHQAAIVEELVEGREVYVGLIGNDDLEVLPLT